MDFIPDELEQTVKIPVKIVNGRITFFYGDNMPHLKEGAIGDLIMPAYAVLDRSLLVPLQEEWNIPLLELETSVLLAMRLKDTPMEWHAKLHAHQERRLHPNYGFVEVVLTSRLELRLRGTKKAVLRGGACYIPALNRNAISLNQAYTFISEVYEPKRQSHTGNVFVSGRYYDHACWLSLDNLRQRHEAEYEQRLIQHSKAPIER